MVENQESISGRSPFAGHWWIFWGHPLPASLHWSSFAAWDGMDFLNGRMAEIPIYYDILFGGLRK